MLFVDPLGLATICFWNLRDISNGDGPPRYKADFEGCIDLPDPLLVTEKGGGGGASRAKLRKKPGLNRDECKELLDKIYEVAKKIYDRFGDMWKDRFSLGVDPEQKVGGVGTLRGHYQQYEGKQTQLSDLLNKFDSNKCKNNTGYPKGKVEDILNWARDMAVWPAPQPQIPTTRRGTEAPVPRPPSLFKRFVDWVEKYYPLS